MRKAFFAYALTVGIVGALAIAAASPSSARQVRKTTTDMGSYQWQSAESSWVATDANRFYGYMGSCANPLAYDPALDPSYDGTLHGE